MIWHHNKPALLFLPPCLDCVSETHNLWATRGPLISSFCLTKNQTGLLMHAQLIPHAWGFWMKENVAIVSHGFSLGSVYPLICLDCWIAQRLLFRYALLLFRMVLRLRYVCLYAQPMSAIHGRNKDVIRPNNKQWGDVTVVTVCLIVGKPDAILHSWWLKVEEHYGMRFVAAEYKWHNANYPEF